MSTSTNWSNQFEVHPTPVMPKSNTPRTDAARLIIWDDQNGDLRAVVPFDDMAKLELELAEANKLLDEAKKVFIEVDKATDERDKWREIAMGLESRLRFWSQDLQKYGYPYYSDTKALIEYDKQLVIDNLTA